MTALGAIWEENHDFSRFAPWSREAEHLLNTKRLPELAQAALLLQCCWTEILWQGDLDKVSKALPEIIRLAEQAHSPSLMVMCSALAVYVYGWQGELAAAELLLQDAEPYLSMNQTSPLSIQQFHNAKALLLTLQGDHTSAQEILLNLLEDEQLAHAPDSVWLMVHAHYLHCLVSKGDKADAEALTKAMLRRTVPEQKWYYHSYLHFNLAVHELAAGRPYKALIHAEESIKRGKLCGSINAIRMPSLLKGQALVDLQRDEEALEFFTDWLPRWEQARYYLIAAQASFEMAMIFCRRNDIEHARRSLDKAVSFTPLKEKVPIVYRQADYQDQLIRTINALQHMQLRNSTPVFIQCLGGFSIISNGNKSDPSTWKGKQSSALLKAIISLGCVDVAVQQVADYLWPDADGDKAIGTFRVTLSRLRSALRDIYPDSDCIQVKKGRVGLDLSICTVDWKVFEERAGRVISTCPDDESQIREVMALYTGEYFAEENEAPWHLHKREKLRRQYVQLSLLLAGQLRKTGRFDEEIACLDEASRHDTTNEQLYLHLMENHLAQGNYSRALEIYKQAEYNLFQAYGVGPGNSLSQLAYRIKEQYRS